MEFYKILAAQYRRSPTHATFTIENVFKIENTTMGLSTLNLKPGKLVVDLDKLGLFFESPFIRPIYDDQDPTSVRLLNMGHGTSTDYMIYAVKATRITARHFGSACIPGTIFDQHLRKIYGLPGVVFQAHLAHWYGNAPPILKGVKKPDMVVMGIDSYTNFCRTYDLEPFNGPAVYGNLPFFRYVCDDCGDICLTWQGKTGQSCSVSPGECKWRTTI